MCLIKRCLKCETMGGWWGGGNIRSKYRSLLKELEIIFKEQHENNKQQGTTSTVMELIQWCSVKNPYYCTMAVLHKLSRHLVHAKNIISIWEEEHFLPPISKKFDLELFNNNSQNLANILLTFIATLKLG